MGSVHGHRRCTLSKINEEAKNAREKNNTNPMFYEVRRRNFLQIKEGKIQTIFGDQSQLDPNSNKRKAGQHEDTPRPKKPKLVKYKKPKLAELKNQGNPTIINKYWRYYLRHFK